MDLNKSHLNTARVPWVPWVPTRRILIQKQTIEIAIIISRDTLKQKFRFLELEKKRKHEAKKHRQYHYV